MYVCDSCLARPATWSATFPDGVGFDLCDTCVGIVDDRVSLARTIPTATAGDRR